MKFNWGHGIIGFLCLFVAGASIAIVQSFRYFPELVEDDYYEKGATYTQQQNIDNRSYVYRDSVRVSESGGGLQIQLCQSIVKASDSIGIYLYRPADKKLDVLLRFKTSTSINLPMEKLKVGRYIAKLSWKQADSIYNIDKEVRLQ